MAESMNNRKLGLRLMLIACAGLAMTACGLGTMAAQDPADERLERQVAAALVNASDVPADSLTVEVIDGVVTLSGSVVCEACGGSLTPAGSATVQQSLGAVVRAIPGVERVEFDLQYQPPADPSGG